MLDSKWNINKIILVQQFSSSNSFLANILQKCINLYQIWKNDGTNLLCKYLLNFTFQTRYELIKYACSYHISVCPCCKEFPIKTDYKINLYIFESNTLPNILQNGVLKPKRCQPCLFFKFGEQQSEMVAVTILYNSFQS